MIRELGEVWGGAGAGAGGAEGSGGGAEGAGDVEAGAEGADGAGETSAFVVLFGVGLLGGFSLLTPVSDEDLFFSAVKDSSAAYFSVSFFIESPPSLVTGSNTSELCTPQVLQDHLTEAAANFFLSPSVQSRAPIAPFPGVGMKPTIANNTVLILQLGCHVSG